MKQTENEGRIFALDIGTRSVIGIVGYMRDGIFRVEYTEREEYKSRAVVDGQIEDISETAKIAVLVKERLEKRLGHKLDSVYIAAAGRVLRTIDSEAELQLPREKVVDKSIVSSLERLAIQNAYEALAREQDSEENYFSVGYSVKRYILDDFEFPDLVGHKGKTAKVSLIVTFLPKEVIDSLYATMNRIDLTVSGLTLEPIAAMNAIIPPDLRKLNLALCDIGAGTSDIAVCDGGCVCAYTVATVAGDEITEAVMQACLVDFSTAERIKKEVSASLDAVIKYENIMGMPREEAARDIFERIEPMAEHLAEIICDRIMKVNGRAPAAVFLVGGGSQTPGLKGYVAHMLGLDENMVAVGGNVYIKKMFESKENILCPDFATPLGIALTAVMQNESNTFSVTINDKKLHLFNIWDTSALGVLQMAGYRYNQIIGKNGKSIVYDYNGQRKTAYGGLPTPAEITINGKTVTLSDTVQPGDVIVFTPSKHGKDAELRLSDIAAKTERFEVFVEGVSVTVGNTVTVNGEEVDTDYELHGGEAVDVETVNTVGELCASAGYSTENIMIFVNDKVQNMSYQLKKGDKIQFTIKKEEKSTTQNDEKGVIIEKSHRNRTNKKQSFEHIINDNDKSGEVRVILNDKELVLPPPNDGEGHCFFDLFAFADIDAAKQGGVLVQLLNGKDASLMEPIKNGDTAKIYWSDKK